MLCIGPCFGSVCTAHAQELPAEQEQHADVASRPPALEPLHERVDWNFYCDPSHKTEYADHLKCISLNASRSSTLSIGGEERQRGDYFDHGTWGQDAPDSGFSLQRYMLYADLHLGGRFRLFNELESGL